ncbi:putative endopeptidase p60 precursor [compost metagenome]
MKKKLLTLLLVPAITLGGIALPVPQPASAATIGKIVASVSFRESPSVDGNRIRFLSNGESVTILEEVNAYWLKVKDSKGRIGYISSNSKYVNSSETAQIISSVSFRVKADENSTRIRYLQTGETVTIISQVNNWWYNVKDSNGQVGYVSTNAKYISTSDSSGSGGGTQTPDVPTSDKAKAVIQAGKKYLGTPYEFGSNRYNTDTFDCSDFVRQAFLDALNHKLPSDSRGQGDYVKSLGNTKTNWKELNPGDLMFFMSYKGPKASDYAGINKSKATINHVGIYLGDGKILHTYSKDSGGVRIDTVAGKSWEYRYLFGGSAMN